MCGKRRDEGSIIRKKKGNKKKDRKGDRLWSVKNMRIRITVKGDVE
jgi:hypothetical protein